jgi:hypothetical protein
LAAVVGAHQVRRLDRCRVHDAFQDVVDRYLAGLQVEVDGAAMSFGWVSR